MTDEDKTPSLRDSLSAAWDTQSGTEPAPVEEVIPDDGQEASAEEQTVESADTDQQESEPEKVIAAPEHWPKEQKDYFEALDDKGKEVFLAKMEDIDKGYLKKSEELAEQRKRYQGIDTFMESLQSQYPDATKEKLASALSQALPNWFNTYVSLQKDPVGTLRKIADAYNVSDKLSESLLGQDNDDSARQKRLREVELEQENERLRSEQTRIAREKAESAIAEFRDATGPDGKALRPYFNELEPVMAKLIQADPSMSLGKAYEVAMRTEKFEELQKQERERVKAELEAERRKKANVRKVTKPTIGRSNGASTSQAKPKSLREQLADNWDDLATRQ